MWGKLFRRKDIESIRRELRESELGPESGRLVKNLTLFDFGVLRDRCDHRGGDLFNDRLCCCGWGPSGQCAVCHYRHHLLVLGAVLRRVCGSHSS